MSVLELQSVQWYPFILSSHVFCGFFFLLIHVFIYFFVPQVTWTDTRRWRNRWLGSWVWSQPWRSAWDLQLTR